MRRPATILIPAVIALSFAGTARAQMYATAGNQQYSVTDIGNLSSQFPYCAVYAINSSGQVAGNSNVSPSDYAHGYFYAGNGAAPADFGALAPGGPYTQSLANGLNDSSVVVGASNGQGFVWTQQSGMQGVGYLTGGTYSVLEAVNNSDVAVGGATRAGAALAHAAIWDSTDGLRVFNPLILNPPTTWTPRDAVAISRNGLIAGIGDSATSTSNGSFPIPGQHAFVLDGGTLTTLPDPGVEMFPASINSAGEVAGSFADSSKRSHAFVYTPQQGQGVREIYSLGLSVTGTSTPGIGASAINDLGTVVGADNWADGSDHAFIYTDSTGIVEFTPPTGAVFDGAYGINDSGQIIAQGYYVNDPAAGYRGFVLSPVPEPSTFFLTLPLVLVAFLCMMRANYGGRSYGDSNEREHEMESGAL